MIYFVANYFSSTILIILVCAHIQQPIGTHLYTRKLEKADSDVNDTLSQVSRWTQSLHYQQNCTSTDSISSLFCISTDNNNNNNNNYD